MMVITKWVVFWKNIQILVVPNNIPYSKHCGLAIPENYYISLIHSHKIS